MASIKISALPALTAAPTNDDVVVINDGDTSTKKQTFSNFTQGIARLTGVAPTFQVDVTVGATAGDQVLLSSTTGRVTSAELVVGAAGTQNTYPTVQGTANQALVSTAPGTLGFATLPSGAANAVQLAGASGVFASDANFTYSASLLSVPAIVATGQITTNSGIRLRDPGGVNFVTLQANAATDSDDTYTWPANFPADAAGMTLHCTNAGVMTWAADDNNSPGGADTQVQFNNAGAFGGSANLTFDGTTVTAAGLSCTGNTVLGDANADTITFTGRIADATSLEPLTNNSVNLGAQALRFNNAFFNNASVTTLTNNAAMTIQTSSGIITLNPAGASVTTNKSIIPNADGTLDLGLTATRWQTAFVDTVNADDLVVIGSGGTLRLTNPANTFTQDFACGGLTANITYTWPDGLPGAGQNLVLHCSDAGVLTWEADDTVFLTNLMGVVTGSADLGTFTGATIPDGSTVKAALQALETTLEAVDIDTNDMATLVGLAENINNLGTFTGSTIADGSTIKTALQALETEVETKISAGATAAAIHLDDLRTALGIAEQATSFGTFSGSTLQDNDTLNDLLQALETAVEARSSLLGGNIFQGEQTLRDKLSIDPGDGGLHLQINRNVSSTQMDILLRDPPSGARLNLNTVNSHADDALIVYSTKFWCRALGGGTGEAEFDGAVQFDDSISLGGVSISAWSDLLSQVNVDHLQTLTGVSATSENLGTFTGSTIADNLTLKAAIQALETATELRANAADSILTGTTKANGVLHIGDDGLNSGYYLKIQRNGNTQLDLLARNIPSGGNLNITNSNGNNARVIVYSDEFWVRNLGGSNGNGTAKFDGDVTFGSEAKFSNNYADKAAAGTGALGDVAVIGGKLCFHDGSDWKEITLGSAPA